MSRVAAIIPNYNGRDLLIRYLPRLHDALGDMCDLVIVDDASTDNSVEFLTSNFPEVRVITREINGGFSRTVNDGIRATSGEFLLLLNNDVDAVLGLLDSILPLFDDEEVFSVSPKVILPHMQNLDEGAKTGKWYHGMFYPDQRQGITSVTPSLYTTGCAAIYRRSMLDALGGFDEAYSPFYWEDADLGYRAWKRGWKSLYQPAGTVYHQHSASISNIRKNFTDRVKTRNSLYFIWRNIEDRRILNNHHIWLPLILARHGIAGDLPFLKGWHDAYNHRQEADVSRLADSQHRRLSDEEIFQIIGIPTG
ncbi:MAG: glycosyltransferase family 2 protein [Armatimonadota bacterium]